MNKRFSKVLAVLVVLFFSLTISSMDVTAQRRNKRRHRRPRTVITNPPIESTTTGAAGDATIVSTADQTTDTEQTADNANAQKPTAKKKTQDMQETINNLSNQVNSLNEKLGQMRDEQRSLLDMERLTRAEQRAETLRAQLRDVEDKQSELQSRLDETSYALKPENIERAVGLIGTTHPEDAREARRHQLENEKSRLENQLSTLDTSHSRLEAAIATADREVDMLRERLDKATNSDQSPTVLNPMTTDTQTDSPPPPKNPNPPQ